LAETAPTESRGEDRALSSTRFLSLAKARWIVLILLMVATVAGAFAYWRYSELYPSTDNAYVGAHIVRVAAEVSGPVSRVYVRNNEVVKQNDPLFDIDAAPYESALREARAQFDRAAQAAGTEADNLKAAANTLAQARMTLIDARNVYQQAKQAQDPTQPPSDALKSAEQGWQDALTALKNAQTGFDNAQNADLTVGAATVQLRAASAALDRAEYNRVRALVDAPSGGWVSDLTLRPGTTVGAGTPLFAVIEDDKWWVDANFKETDLARIREGQPATVVLDMYPNVELEGTVESISAGSGAVFSVLPPENATGNWVKVTQRFAVRVMLPAQPQDQNKPLRVGASASVTVDTTKAPQQSAAQGKSESSQPTNNPAPQTNSDASKVSQAQPQPASAPAAEETTVASQRPAPPAPPQHNPQRRNAQ
jgi:membrane fusion protein (multidrug efflux system)